MAYMINYAYVSNIGNVRKNNEDNFWCNGIYMPVQNQGTGGVMKGTTDWDTSPAFAVFDGMGGESCGEIASGIAAHTFDEILKKEKRYFFKAPGDFLDQTCRKLNTAVLNYEEQHMIDSMGSTAVVMMLKGNTIYGMNAGDSRMYLHRGGVLRKISTDHSMADTAFRKGPLLQYLGFIEDETQALTPTIVNLKPKSGDRLLLCSDGLTDMVDDETISQILSGTETPEEAANVLLHQALENGGRDNITIILCEIPKISSIGLCFRNMFAGKRRKVSDE